MGIKGNRRGERDVGCAGVTAGCLRKGVVEAVYRQAIAPGKQVTINGQGKAGGVKRCQKRAHQTAGILARLALASMRSIRTNGTRSQTAAVVVAETRTRGVYP